MPNKDGTGPIEENNFGRMGRGRGCNRFDNNFGQRKCFRFNQNITLTKEEEKMILQIQLKNIEAEKELIQTKIKEIEKE